MKREQLEALGVAAEAINEIMKLNGADIEKEKAKGVANTEKITQLEEQLETTKEALEKFKDVNPEELNATIESLKQDLINKETEYTEKEQSRLFKEMISGNIKELGGKNEKAIMALLDLDALKGSNNQQNDLATALAGIKETDGYLFGSGEPVQNAIRDTGNINKQDSQTDMMRSIMGLPTNK